MPRCWDGKRDELVRRGRAGYARCGSRYRGRRCAASRPRRTGDRRAQHGLWLASSHGAARRPSAASWLLPLAKAYRRDLVDDARRRASRRGDPRDSRQAGRTLALHDASFALDQSVRAQQVRACTMISSAAARPGATRSDLRSRSRASTTWLYRSSSGKLPPAVARASTTSTLGHQGEAGRVRHAAMPHVGSAARERAARSTGSLPAVVRRPVSGRAALHH